MSIATPAPNENIKLEDFILNIKLIAVLLAEFAAQDLVQPQTPSSV